MRRNIKKIISMMLIMIVLLSTALVFADITVLRVSPCPNANCTGGLFTQRIYGEWNQIGTRLCIHYSKGADIKEEASVVVNVSCNTCSYGYSYNETATRWICEGHN